MAFLEELHNDREKSAHYIRNVLVAFELATDPSHCFPSSYTVRND